MKKKILKELVGNAILFYMGDGFAFTAIDICNYLRGENPDKVIKYREVSNIVKKLTLVISQSYGFQYNATLQKANTATGMTLTYVYHDKDFDPENYMSRDQTTLQTL